MRTRTHFQATYNEIMTSYKDTESAPVSFVMKVSSNGQISIPASVRARWKADEVVVVDMGNRVVMRPRSSDPVGNFRGKAKGRTPTTDELRRVERQDEAARERRRYG